MDIWYFYSNKWYDPRLNMTLFKVYYIIFTAIQIIEWLVMI